MGAYAAGSSPAGLVFDNNKLAIDFAQTIAQTASTKVYPSSVIKTYVDEQISSAKTAANNTFSNAIAGLTGNPGNVQAALEAAASEIDGVISTATSRNTTASQEYAKIANLRTALGSTTDNMGAFNTALITDNATAKAAFEDLGTAVTSLRTDTGTTLGVNSGSTLPAISNTVTGGRNTLEALQDIVAAVELIEGDLTSILPQVNQYHNATDFPLTLDQLNGVSPVNTVQYNQYDEDGTTVLNAFSTDLTTLTNDITILVDYGAAGDVNAGIYTRDVTTGNLSRVSWFNESSEIQKNAILQIKSGGYIAGTRFQVATPDSPAIGTDPIGFSIATQIIVGEGTIEEPQLGTALAAKINAKVNKSEHAVVVPADGDVDVNHGLGSRAFVISIYDNAFNEVTSSFEIDRTDLNNVKITSGFDVNKSINVVIVG